MQSSANAAHENAGGNAAQRGGESAGGDPSGDPAGAAGQAHEAEGGAGTLSAGAGVGPTCDPMEDAVVPECFSYASWPLLPIPGANGVAVAGVVSAHGGFELTASRRGSNMLAVTWTDPFLAWPSFVCFDALPGPDRLAATTLLDDVPEFFAVGRCGLLYQRTIILGSWTEWARVTLPSPTFVVTDVATAVAPDGTTLMYVTDNGSVFVRHRNGTDAHGPYGHWVQLGGRAGSLITAGTRADGRQQVFTLDTRGRLLTAIQSTTDLDAPFTDWVDFDSADVPPFVDIESPYGLAAIEMYAVDADGGIWTRQEDGVGGFSPWQLMWSASPGALAITMLSGSAVGKIAGAPLALAGAGPAGVSVKRRLDGVWEDTWTHPQ